MCGAPTDDASPTPVTIEDNDDATTVLNSKDPSADDAATRVVNRSRGARINVAVPKPAPSSAANGPLDAEEDMKTTTINANSAPVGDSEFDYAATSILNMPPAVDKDEYAADDTGLFVDPDDDVSTFAAEVTSETRTERIATEDRGIAEVEQSTWSSMQRNGNRSREQKKPRSKATTIVGIALAAVAVVCLGILAFVLFGPNRSSSSSTVGTSTSLVGQGSATGLKVAIPVSVPGLDAKGSRIPVHVSGQTSSGVAVDEDAYIGHDGNGLLLEPGTYDVRAVGSPISADGVLYTIPDKSITVNFVDGLVFTKNSSEKITLREISAEDTTIAQINAAYEWVTKDPERSDRAEELLEAARNRRAEAVAVLERQRAEQERQKEAERQQAANAVAEEQ
ncbi:MAG: hypothetical protein Q4A07_11340, partial [Coriobacteriales bacterium]|nr:hypothetical protein [Coriobacteriales bacterium]